MMSESMVERVARAILADQPDADWDYVNSVPGHPLYEMSMRLARAAIAAMREPTDEMKAIEGVHWGYSCHVCGGLQEGWQAMIDAALREEGP